MCSYVWPTIRMHGLRDVADKVGITERTAFRLIGELEEAGVLERAKEGRRNHYVINTDAHLRHAIEEHCTVGELLETVLQQSRIGEQQVGDIFDEYQNTALSRPRPDIVVRSRRTASSPCPRRSLPSTVRSTTKIRDGKDAIFCVRYVQGFIDGAVATDARVLENIATEFDRG